VGLGGYLSTVISSADVGLHKPDPRIFEVACQHLGVSASEAVHVGDHHYADVAGAMAAGMTAVLIDRNSSACESIGRRIESLDGIEEVLGLRR
jgi:putative hydrolase of the HAD superfamily